MISYHQMPTGWTRARVIDRISRGVGCSQLEAVGRYASLVDELLRAAPDGDATGVDPRDLAVAFDWDGEIDGLLPFLQDLGVLDAAGVLVNAEQMTRGFREAQRLRNWRLNQKANSSGSANGTQRDANDAERDANGSEHSSQTKGGTEGSKEWFGGPIDVEHGPSPAPLRKPSKAKKPNSYGDANGTGRDATQILGERRGEEIESKRDSFSNSTPEDAPAAPDPAGAGPGPVDPNAPGKPEGPEDKVLGTFPIRGGGGTWEFRASHFAILAEAFGDQDIRSEMRRAKGWLLSNPTQQKTAGGMMRFLNAWLSKKVDRRGPPDRAVNAAPDRRALSEQAFDAFAKERP